jgi:serine/threonine protein kinase
LQDWIVLRERKDFAFHVFDILEQIVNRLIIIHSHQEVHRDLHPGNGELRFSVADVGSPLFFPE